MYWHVTIGVRGRFSLIHDEALLRVVLLALARTAGEGLLLFSVVDDHLHLLFRGSRAEVGHRVSGVSRALCRLAAGAPLEPAFFRAVRDIGHLRNMVRYAVRQPVKHDVGVHPALWTGSCLLDLVGARCLPGYDPGRIRGELPRDDVTAIALDELGLRPKLCRSASDAELRALGLAPLAAALRSAATLPDGEGRGVSHLAFRAAYARLVVDLGLSANEARRIVGESGRAWDRSVARPADAALLEAVRRRVGFESEVIRTPFRPRAAA